MKKLILLVLVCLIFTGCTAKKTVIVNENLNIEEIPSEIFDFASESISDEESFYYIGNGVTVSDISDDGKIISKELCLYPVYTEEEITALILKNKDGKLELTNNNIDYKQLQDKLIIVNNEEIYVIDESGETMAVKNKLNKLNTKILEQIELTDIKTNKFGEDRRLLKSGNTVIDPSSGRRFSSSRLVVKFTDGDTEKNISDFEEFCNGKLRSSIKSVGIYVFEIEAANYKRLSYLVEQAKQLDYVEDVYLDEQRDMNSPSIIVPNETIEEAQPEYQTPTEEKSILEEFDTNTTEEDLA